METWDPEIGDFVDGDDTAGEVENILGGLQITGPVGCGCHRHCHCDCGCGCGCRPCVPSYPYYPPVSPWVAPRPCPWHRPTIWWSTTTATSSGSLVNPGIGAVTYNS
jgi:hypothetical protein